MTTICPNCEKEPEDIRAFRRRQGLTRQTLADLLDWAAVTLTRYEHGALQSDEHDRALKQVIAGS